MLGQLLREGFQLAHRRIDRFLLDLLWKFVWLILTVTGFLGVLVSFTSEFRSIAWIVTHWQAIAAYVITVGVLSIAAWLLLEATFRSRLFSGVHSRFGTFLLSNVLKYSMMLSAALALGTISLAGPDRRGGAWISIVTIAALGFLLTVLDTLLRSDALELLGTDLFRVTGLITILLSFEAMIVAACAVALTAGLLNIAGLKSALGMLAAIGVVIGFLNVVHSYLLLVRYSAVDIMRKNVIEV